MNFWVNLTDFFWTGVINEYYHDEFFTTSFSNKVHQIVLCATLAYIVANFMQPSERHQSDPNLLSVMFMASFFVQVSFVICFNLELTWFTPEKRIKVFKTEILKVMMTMVYFNFFALIFMSWMWELSKAIK